MTAPPSATVAADGEDQGMMDAKAKFNSDNDLGHVSQERPGGGGGRLSD
jgi:hypothetical protein